jgi:hypothetical protein
MKTRRTAHEAEFLAHRHERLELANIHTRSLHGIRHRICLNNLLICSIARHFYIEKVL